MTRTKLDDAQWASLMLVMQQIPRAWKRDEVALRRFIAAALWICRTGAPWRDLPEALGQWSSVYHRWRRWCLRGWWELIFEALRPSLPADGLILLDSTTCKAHRAASGAASSTASAEALGRSRGGLCSKLHACADGAGRILRLIASPGHHADLRYATALAMGLPACNAALDRGYVSAALRAAFAAEGCTVHTPPKRGMVDPPDWDPTLYAQRHHIENLFSSLKDWVRLAFRRDKTRRSWTGFAHLAATIINLRIAASGHRP
ncbi:IS5 family transposase [Pseudoroseomonas wenyumeiae]|uniref:IS5 family transposase n=1 Tax=Teichococcus wenyumeiae TaxID=2478470 RepID=A0A3A9JJI9_9PROT|nr:IS5 family transposase [Pseudoroseomonas wenyumeiae]RKJ96070.1 IS5 family transposase [Pseudoroseomonas wenyumeiae]RMI13250.1 IS5 family transposase [Pseudoroseomonas wenyumeiae]